RELGNMGSPFANSKLQERGVVPIGDELDFELIIGEKYIRGLSDPGVDGLSEAIIRLRLRNELTKYVENNPNGAEAYSYNGINCDQSRTSKIFGISSTSIRANVRVQFYRFAD
ncbi:MAG: hypothetical protein ABIH72_02770, partial [archaeon]